VNVCCVPGTGLVRLREGTLVRFREGTLVRLSDDSSSTYAFSPDTTCAPCATIGGVCQYNNQSVISHTAVTMAAMFAA
jgi:hypothetical protein